MSLKLLFVFTGQHREMLDQVLTIFDVRPDFKYEVSPDFYRPTDVVNLWGDPTKAKAVLGWNSSKTSFEELVKLMVESDMAKVAVEREGERVRTNLAAYLEKGIVK